MTTSNYNTDDKSDYDPIDNPDYDPDDKASDTTPNFCLDDNQNANTR
jgi:hypothetical protein